MCSLRTFFFRVICVCALFTLSAVPVSAQKAGAGARAPSVASNAKPRIAVFGFLNFTGNDSFDTPAETATKTLALSLRIIGQYEIVESDVFLRDLSDQNLAQYCAKSKMDYILYGSLKMEGDSQRYTLAVFDLQKGKTTISETATGTSVLDVFGVTDTLIGSVLDSLTGHHVGFGSLRFVNTGVPGRYEIRVDDVALPANSTGVDYVIAGTHTVRIVKIVGTDSVEVSTETVEIGEGSTKTVSFALPPDPAPEPVVPAVPEASAVSEPESVEPVPEEIPAVEEPKQDANALIYRSSLELYGSYGLGLGNYANLVESMIGGGFETSQRFTRTSPFSIAFRGAGNFVVPKHNDIEAFQNGSLLMGISCQIPVLYVFALRPAIMGGVWVNRIILSETAGVYDRTGALRKMENQVYLEPAFQASLDIILYFKSFGIMLGPVFTVFPLNALDPLYAAGARAGIFARLNRVR
jgi:TolB-like protein